MCVCVCVQVMEPAFRAPYVNVNRWFLTCVNQPQFKTVLGEIEICSKMAVFDGKWPTERYIVKRVLICCGGFNCQPRNTISSSLQRKKVRKKRLRRRKKRKLLSRRRQLLPNQRKRRKRKRNRQNHQSSKTLMLTCHLRELCVVCVLRELCVATGALRHNNLSFSLTFSDPSTWMHLNVFTQMKTLLQRPSLTSGRSLTEKDGAYGEQTINTILSSLKCLCRATSLEAGSSAWIGFARQRLPACSSSAKKTTWLLKECGSWEVKS